MLCSTDRSKRFHLVSWLALAAWTLPAAASAEFFAEGSLAAGVIDQHGDDADEDPLENADAFTLIVPRGVFLHSSDRARHRGSYALSTRLNLRRSTGHSVSNRADWLSRIAISEAGRLSLSASAHQGHTSAYDLAFPQIVEPLPEGGIHFVSGNVNQSLSHRVGRAWRVRQLANAGIYYPFSGDLNVDSSYQAGGGLSLQRTFRHDAITGAVEGRYVSISRPAIDDLDTVVTDRHIVGGAHLSGARALSHRWTAELGAGVVGLANAESPDDPLILPSAFATIRYTVGGGSAALSYSHDIDTRLVIAETSATHVAQLRGVLPVQSLDGVWMAGALGYRNGRIIDSTSRDYIGRSDVFMLDGQVAWEFRRGFTASAQVQSFLQHREERTASLARDQSRSQFMITLSARYPAVEAATIPPGAGAEWAPAGGDSDD